MNFTVARRPFALATAGLISLTLVTACQTSRRTEGQKRVDDVSEHVERVAELLQENKLELQQTLAHHDALVANRDGKMEAHYRDYVRGIDRAENASDELSRAIAEIRVAAAPYYSSWRRELTEITDPDLRARSEERMEDARKRLDEVQEIATRVRDRSTPVLIMLRDHARFLGNELNADATASLESEMPKLRSAVDDLVAQIDDASDSARAYAAGIAIPSQVRPASSSRSDAPPKYDDRD